MDQFPGQRQQQRSRLAGLVLLLLRRTLDQRLIHLHGETPLSVLNQLPRVQRIVRGGHVDAVVEQPSPLRQSLDHPPGALLEIPRRPLDVPFEVPGKLAGFNRAEGRGELVAHALDPGAAIGRDVTERRDRRGALFSLDIRDGGVFEFQHEVGNGRGLLLRLPYYLSRQPHLQRRQNIRQRVHYRLNPDADRFLAKQQPQRARPDLRPHQRNDLFARLLREPDLALHPLRIQRRQACDRQEIIGFAHFRFEHRRQQIAAQQPFRVRPDLNAQGFERLPQRADERVVLRRMRDKNRFPRHFGTPDDNSTKCGRIAQPA